MRASWKLASATLVSSACSMVLGLDEERTIASATNAADASPAETGGPDAPDGEDGSGTFGDVIELAKTQGLPTSIAVDATDVYVTDRGAGMVVRIPKAGGEPKVMASPLFSPDYVHVTATHLYWARTVPNDNCTGGSPGAATILGMAKTDTQASSVVSSVYCQHTGVMHYDGVAFYEFRYGSSMLIRSTGGTTTEIKRDEDGTTAIASTGGAFYWARGNAGTVQKWELPSGPAIPFLLKLAGPRDIVVDGTSVYFATDGGDIGKLEHDKAGQPPTILARGEKFPQRLALDGDNVFWTNKGDGTIRTVPKAGGEVRTLASNQIEPNGIAVDAQGVYWVSGGDFAVRKVPR